MGAGLTVYNYINDLLVDGSNLNAAGNFGATAATIQPLAVWDDLSWSIVGDGQLLSDGLTLTKFNGEIYLGGYMYSTATSPAGVYYLGKLDSGNFVPIDNNANGQVFILYEFNNELYAGGAFSRIGPSSAFISRYSHPYLAAGANTLKDLTLSNPSTVPVTFSDSLTLSGTFTDITAGSVLKFHSGSTYTFPSINIAGAAGNLITMGGTSSSAWNFNVAAAAPTVSYVSASYSDASGGSEIDASDGTNTNGLNNVHWNFGSGPVVDHIIVSPSSATLATSGTQTFTAVAYDAGNAPIPSAVITWSVVASGGSIDGSGIFTAGTTAGTYTNTVQATSGGVNGYATVVVSSVLPPAPPPPPSGDGMGGGSDENLIPTVEEIINNIGTTSLLDFITDNADDEKYSLSEDAIPIVEGHFPIFSGTTEPNTELNIIIMKDSFEIVDDTFYSLPDGSWSYQTKEELAPGQYQVSVSIVGGSGGDGSSPWYSFEIKETVAEQISQVEEGIGLKFEDLWKVLKETNPQPFNIILLIISTILMAHGLINAFSGFFSAQFSVRQYILAFFNSIFVVGGKRKKIGFVFDSASRKRMHGALVTLYEASKIKLRGTALTDKKGQYLFSVDEGSYVMSVKKNGYLFPSQFRVEASESYYGQPLNFERDSNVIKEIIPIDPVNNAVRKESIYLKIYIQIFVSAATRWVVLLAGTFIAIFALIINPAVVNFIILGCYIVLYILEFVLQHKESSYCRVIDATTGRPVDLALLRIYNATGKLVGTYVTDRQGRVSPYIEENNFTLAVERVGYQKTEQFFASPRALVHKKIYLRTN
ncbi:MAG: hypothetical protein PHW65_04415 [Dehalococcoidales bacterium]|nr:hypothetical protein [Dehalococcoidales bacterium]